MSSIPPPPQSAATGPRPSLFGCRGLVRGYGRHEPVLKGVNLGIAGGGIVALVGPNGAGKTTLVASLSGLLAPWEGEILIDSQAVSLIKDTKRKAEIGTVIGGPTLVEDLRPTEFWELVAALNSVPRELARERTSEAAERLDLIPSLRKLNRELSAGTRKKVEAIAALVTEPRILLLDEPFEALDPPAVVALSELVAEYVAQHNACALISSHILPWVKPLASEIQFLWDGRLHSRAEVEQLVGGSDRDRDRLKAWSEILAA